MVEFNKVELEVTKSPIPIDIDAYELKRIELDYGATYKVDPKLNFNHTVWICPVTLCVLGEYPKYIYIHCKKYTESL